jgi:hypothetical protein
VAIDRDDELSAASRGQWRLLPGLLLLAAVTTVAGDACAADLLDRLIPGRQPDLRAVRAGRFLLISDAELHDAGGIAADLDALHDELQSELRLPGIDEAVRVYIFARHTTFAHYVRKHIPYLARVDTHRRGLFLLRNGVPHIFVVRDEHFTASLRHEFVHVVLNTSAPGLPLWLDEGLAMYYETLDDPDRRAELTRRLAKRQARGWRPDLARLEQFDEMPEMDELAYAEAWAWVRLVQEGPAEVRDLLPAYLSDLSGGRKLVPLSDRLPQRLGDISAAWQATVR